LPFSLIPVPKLPRGQRTAHNLAPCRVPHPCRLASLQATEWETSSPQSAAFVSGHGLSHAAHPSTLLYQGMALAMPQTVPKKPGLQPLRRETSALPNRRHPPKSGQIPPSPPCHPERKGPRTLFSSGVVRGGSAVAVQPYTAIRKLPESRPSTPHRTNLNLSCRAERFGPRRAARRDGACGAEGPAFAVPRPSPPRRLNAREQRPPP